MKKILNSYLDKKVLTEINRMREIMGLKLLNESDGAYTKAARKTLKALGYDDSYIDNFIGKISDDINLTSLADEFTSLGIKNADDLLAKAATEAGVSSIDDVSEEAILNFIKKNPDIYKSIEAKVSKTAKEAAEQSMEKLQLSDIFPDRTLYDNILTYSNKPLNEPYLADDIDLILKGLDGISDDLTSKGLPIPDSLNNLKGQFTSQKASIEGFTAAKTKPRTIRISEPVDDVARAGSDEVVDDGARAVSDEVVDDISTDIPNVPQIKPEEQLNEYLTKYADDIFKKYPDVTMEEIQGILNKLKLAYGTVTPENLLSKIDELTKKLEKDLQDLQKKYDDDIAQGATEEAAKKKKNIEKLKQILNFLGDNKITRFCIGNKTQRIPNSGGKTKTNVDFNASTFLRTPGCLIGLAILSDFMYNYNKDPMDKEFLGCPLVAQVGGCSKLPSGWCSSSCGQRTEEYSDINECFGSVNGWSEMPFKSRNALISLGIDCSYRQKDIYPKKFITSIKYFPGSGGAEEYWNLTIDSKNYTLSANKPLPEEITGNNTTPTPTPTTTPNPPTTTYNNDPAGYKQYAEDKGGTYGVSGNYVMQDGIPFYKDSNGNWQAGSYDTTIKTFKTN